MMPHHSPLLLLLALFANAISSRDAFSAPRQNFHQVLQRVGKTVFRPGGSEATDTLHGWAPLSQDSFVIEIASGLGTGGMALANKYNCHVLLTDFDDSRLQQAQAVAVQKGLQELVVTQVLDMNHIDEGLDKSKHFDVAIVEASLTHEPDAQKRKVIQDISKYADEILMHEVVLLTETNAHQVKQQIGEALAIGFNPMTLDGWRELVSDCGFQVCETEHGSLRLLNPSSLLRDEGVKGVARIAWNLATHKELRDRVVETKRVIDANRDSLGYLILRAVKKKI